MNEMRSERVDSFEKDPRGEDEPGLMTGALNASVELIMIVPRE